MRHCYEKSLAARYEHDVLRLGGKSWDEVREIHRDMAKRAPVRRLDDDAITRGSRLINDPERMARIRARLAD